MKSKKEKNKNLICQVKIKKQESDQKNTFFKYCHFHLKYSFTENKIRKLVVYNPLCKEIVDIFVTVCQLVFHYPIFGQYCHFKPLENTKPKIFLCQGVCNTNIGQKKVEFKYTRLFELIGCTFFSNFEHV